MLRRSHLSLTNNIGLDVLADAKREAKLDGAFKVPRERVSSTVASQSEEESSDLSELDEGGNGISSNGGNIISRRYREHAVPDTPTSGTLCIPFWLSAACNLVKMQ